MAKLSRLRCERSLPRSIEDAFVAPRRENGIGRVFEGRVYFQAEHSRVEIPIPYGVTVGKAYLYCNVNAEIALNGGRMRLQLGEDGFWELVVNTVVKQLNVAVETGPGIARWVLVA